MRGGGGRSEGDFVVTMGMATLPGKNSGPANLSVSTKAGHQTSLGGDLR